MKNLTDRNQRQNKTSALRRGLSLLALAGILPTTACAAAPGGPDIASHPTELKFSELSFTPPEAAKARSVLSNGTPVYVVEDPSLPLVDLQVMIRVGAYLVPAGKEGIAGAVGSQIRAAGVEGRSPEAFDEEVAFLAADMSTSIGNTQGSASFNCLTKDLEQVMELFFHMLRKPAFDQKRLEIYRSQVLQNLARRNDSTDSIESREWQRLLRGPEHFTNDKVTKTVVEGITREDLTAFHRKHFHPGNFIISVSGDVKRERVLALLEKHLAGWKSQGGEPAKIPAPGAPASPGVYMVDKPDVNQGRVGIGHIGVKRDHPDYFALRVMNHILGGGGFVSRIMSRVRSDEGLAYTARSSYDFGVYYPGIFRAYFQ
nr:insulinase family protein [Planctomycetota bacterium]